MEGRLSAETQSENVLRPPEKARYRGATAPNYPGVSNNGVIALTKRRLVFLTVTGKPIEIPVSEIKGIHQAKVFKSSVVGGKTHLVVEVSGGRGSLLRLRQCRVDYGHHQRSPVNVTLQ